MWHHGGTLMRIKGKGKPKPARKYGQPAYIYVMEFEDGLVKIGRSVDPRARSYAVTYLYGVGRPVKVEAYGPFPYAFHFETTLQGYLRQYRQKVGSGREFFYDVPREVLARSIDDVTDFCRRWVAREIERGVDPFDPETLEGIAA